MSKLIVGQNDLETWCENNNKEHLLKEWNYEKNSGLTPIDVTRSSNKKVWWKCSKGHEWQTTISHRNSGNNCPYCSNQKVLQGFNDLSTTNPELASEWNYEKNGDLKPTNVTCNSHKKVWWKCSNGHEYQTVITYRNNGTDCPYCSNKKVLPGYNDLATTNPELASEWNYEKNGNLKPTDVTYGSTEKVWWKCSKGHEWQAIVNNRKNSRNCPICSSEQRTSFPEYALWYYLKQIDNNWIHTYKDLNFELDLFNPNLKIGIEYDGYFWHKDKISNDILKNKKCKENNIILYRIRELLSTLNDISIDIEYDGKHINELIATLVKQIHNKTITINIDENLSDIYQLQDFEEKKYSLATINPELASEWNYKKNGNLKPTDVTCGSNKKVWWKCSERHEWQATISDRANGRGCPYCSNKKVLPGFNDLATTNPKLASEWDYEKNDDLKPTDVMHGSGKKVWWKCSKGHEWKTTINSRNDGTGCPYCSGRYAIKGHTDLTTTNPELASEWNYEKNVDLKPTDVTYGSTKKVWWKCPECNHEWNAIISNRVKGRGCPKCHHKPKL